MSDDVECPYCGEDNEVCHDDGAGYDESQKHEMQCHACDKYFVFTTSISYNYSAGKADCLNGQAHKLRESPTYPKRYARMECVDCDYSEKLPAERLAKILAEEAAPTAQESK